MEEDTDRIVLRVVYGEVLSFQGRSIDGESSYGKSQFETHERCMLCEGRALCV